ncbi:MAG: hypothetical protein NVSMB55_21850 [Mycobacteriales bacterium]
MQLPDLHVIPRPETTSVGGLSRAVEAISADLSCEQVDIRLRRDDAVRCLVVTAADGRLGLVSRVEFQHRMAGPMGYGRVIFGRRPISELADWGPLVARHDADVAHVAALVLDRQSEQNVSDVLVVAADGVVSTLPVRELFQALAEQYAARAVSDALTGLGNRELFLNSLDRACGYVNDGRGSVAVLYIDLDGFKGINDGVGHHAGDDALRTVAARLRACFRAEDLVARLGGDEFAVLMMLDPAVDGGDASADVLAGRALASLSEQMTLRGVVLPGRASIGLAVSSNRDADGETLLREADLAMYRAKAGGGGRVEVVREVRAALGNTLQARPPGYSRMLLALSAGEIVLHYQPIVHVHSGQLASVEALARWAHPELGLLGPGEFLHRFDDTGLAVAFGEYVLRAACAQLRIWRDAFGEQAPPRINVNLSVRQLLDPTLVASVLGALGSYDLPPGVLRLELPEVATLAQMQQARTALVELRDAGIALTLDDLGAGASSLTHLTQIALDGIKIDRQFVAGMLDDDRDMAVVRMLLEMANALRLAVTAEGVETRGQLAALRQLSAGRPSYLQGYLICRPVAAHHLLLPWPEGVERQPAAPDMPAALRQRR